MAPRLTDQQRAYRALSEKQFQKQITDLADMYGWKWVHFSDSRAVNKRGQAFGDKQAAGFPDLLLIRPPEIVVIECKAELGKTRPNQDEWLALFAGCEVDSYVARPSTFDEVKNRLTRARPV